MYNDSDATVRTAVLEPLIIPGSYQPFLVFDRFVIYTALVAAVTTTNTKCHGTGTVKQADSDQAFTTHERASEARVLRLTFAGHGMVHLLEGVIPPLIPLLMLQFGTNYFRIGLVATVFTYLFGLGALPSGVAVDYIGARRLLSIFFVSAGLLSVLVIFVDSYPGYLVIMALVGIAASLYHPAGLTFISQEACERGRAFGIHGIGGSLGIALAPVLAAFLGSQFGWRTPHVVFGVFSIMLGIWSLNHGTVSSSSRHASRKPKEKHKPRSRETVLMLGLMYASFAVLGLAYRGMTTFLPAYMAQEVRLGGALVNPVIVGGTVATIALVSGMLGQYAGGLIADRVRPEVYYAGATAVAGVLALAMSFFSGLLLVVVAIAQAFCAFAAQPVQNLLVSKYLSRNKQGLAFGFKYLMIFGIGSLSATLSGFLADRFGLASVFAAMSLFYFSGAVMGISLWKVGNRQVDTPGDTSTDTPGNTEP